MAYSRPSGRRSFSSQYHSPQIVPSVSVGSYSAIRRSSLDLMRNAPDISFDPRDHEAKTQEKEQIVGLNDRFAQFIEKVRNLEQQNKVLSTRLKILQEQDTYKANIQEIVSELSHNLQRQVDVLARDQQKLESDLEWTQEQVEQNRAIYGDEILKKTELENDFVLIKKDVDGSYLEKVSSELHLEDLMGKIDFLTRSYEEEIKELQSQIQNGKVVLEVDNAPELDLNELVSEVKAQYEDIAARSRADAEQWHQKKMDDMTSKAKDYETELRNLKKEMAETLRYVQKLTSDLDGLSQQRKRLESEIKEVEEREEVVVAEAMAHIRELEVALNQAKGDIARQMQEYQELMNLKLAMDIEIATYRKLLEGEEMRIADQGQGDTRRNVDVQALRPQSLLSPVVASKLSPKKSVLIKQMETKGGKVN